MYTQDCLCLPYPGQRSVPSLLSARDLATPLQLNSVLGHRQIPSKYIYFV